MAEFTEVMRQARRMCEAFSEGNCDECPIGDAKVKVLACGITVTSEKECEEVERRVMQWAATHSELAYPSWNEWYKQNFPAEYNDSKRICPRIFGDGKNCYRETDCDRCRNGLIPADIAKKLGIKPITPNNPVPDHDGCDKCKYEDKSCNDEPCKRCRGNIGEPAPDLWEEG